MGCKDSNVSQIIKTGEDSTMEIKQEREMLGQKMVKVSNYI
jgi:hypothetical protein